MNTNQNVAEVKIREALDWGREVTDKLTEQKKAELSSIDPTCMLFFCNGVFSGFINAVLTLDQRQRIKLAN